jgi:dihydroorotase/N-acyl-D-amino-acid deacylase
MVAWDHSLEGRRLYDWVVDRGLEPTLENAATLVIEAELKGGAGAIYHVMDDGDVERIMRYPMTAIASDGRLSRPGVGHPHPRAYGTFPRVLGVYVREKHVLTLPDAVRKMTSLRPGGWGWRIAAGWPGDADIAVFDPATARPGDLERPHQYGGHLYVIVNGVVWWMAVFTDAGRASDPKPR